MPEQTQRSGLSLGIVQSANANNTTTAISTNGPEGFSSMR